MGDVTCKFYLDDDTKPCLHYIEPYDKLGCGFCSVSKQFRCTEDLKTKQPPLSYSAVDAWLRCKMYYKFFYLMGIRQKPQYVSDALKMGSVWDAIQNYEGGVGTNEDIKNVISMYELSDVQVSIISALWQAFKDLEIKVPSGESQRKFHLHLYDNVITGVTDHAMVDGFKERKLSTSPDYYLKIENIHTQCGTYFLSCPEWEYVDMEVTQLPQLRMTKRESIEDFERRVYGDVISRPSHYFQGFNRDTRTYGKRFYRNEFDLDYISKMYQYIFREIRETIDRGSWYRNDRNCLSPFQCMYLDIKRSGAMSETVYYIAGKHERKEANVKEEN